MTKCFAENLDLERTSIKVLFKSPDRKNIYEQRRFISKPVDVRLELLFKYCSKNHIRLCSKYLYKGNLLKNTRIVFHRVAGGKRDRVG